VTTITADTTCKAQNNAGFWEILCCSQTPCFVGERLISKPAKAPVDGLTIGGLQKRKFRIQGDERCRGKMITVASK
jgi:hypothetical protein